jgi:hypothetical protein
MLLVVVFIMLFGDGREGYAVLVYYKLTGQTSAGLQLKRSLERQQDSIVALQHWFAQNYTGKTGHSYADTFQSKPMNVVSTSGDACVIIVNAIMAQESDGESSHQVFQNQLLLSCKNVKNRFDAKEVLCLLDNDRCRASSPFWYDAPHTFFSINIDSAINAPVALQPFYTKKAKKIKLTDGILKASAFYTKKIRKITLFDDTEKPHIVKLNEKTATELQKHLCSLHDFETNRICIPCFYTVFYRLF